MCTISIAVVLSLLSVGSDNTQSRLVEMHLHIHWIRGQFQVQFQFSIQYNHTPHTHIEHTVTIHNSNYTKN